MIQIKTEGTPALFYHQPDFLPQELRHRILQHLEATEFLGGQNTNGKDIPRRQLWFQRDNGYFCERWHNRYPRWESNSYTPELDELEKHVQEKIKILLANSKLEVPKLNSMLINKYRDGSDSIRAHRDSPTSFGEEPTIIVISLGSPRDLVFRKVKTDENPQSTEIDTDYPQEFEFKMTDNSLFIMGGGSQRYYTHEIPKSDEAGFRYSITMREYIPH